MAADNPAFASQAEWLEWQARHRAELASQHLENRALLAALPTQPIEGFCSLCNARRLFACIEGTDAVAVRVRDPASGLPEGIWILRATR